MKKIIFSKIDNHKGKVCSVYSLNECLKTTQVPDHRRMNIEHTWPKSLGATGIARSDMHHLFPTNSRINSIRSSHPFCNVVEVIRDEDGSKLGRDESGTMCFEPPSYHKGNVARAIFYFAVKYDYKLDAAQEETLRKWHKDDPVVNADLVRNQAVFNFQRNSNLFIEYPQLVSKIEDF